MTPFVGFHTLLAILMAFLMRANIIASVLGTIVGNPWTFAFVWPLTYETGRLILGTKLRENLDFEALFENLKNALFSENFSQMGQDVKEVVWPMAVGSIIFFVVVFVLSFFAVKYILRRIRKN